MHYAEVNFILDPVDPWRDILIAELDAIGFEGYEETTHGFCAFIPSERYDPAALETLFVLRDPHVKVTRTVRMVEQRNWNAEWEKSFDPVEVGTAVRIRAEFHPFVPGFAHDIVITPRMAFGTGHHATTRMMVEAMLGLELAGTHVCDLGCGTAVLAILAERLGAASVSAIDIDGQAVINARENIALNNCGRIVVEKGTAALLQPDSCGAILANIERNTLLHDMTAMRDALTAGGALLLSGFIHADAALMQQAVAAAGMRNVEHLQDGEWTLIGCRK